MAKQLLGNLEINRIYQRDCIEGMRMIPDKSIDMILCDLPYGTTACKWDTIIPFDTLWEQYERIIKDNGAIVLTASQPFTSALIMSKPKMFRHCWVWNKRYPANFPQAKRQPMKIHEDVCVFSKKGANYLPIMEKRDKPIKKGANKGADVFHLGTLDREDYKGKVYDEKYPESIIFFPTRQEGKKAHPTQKPVALFEYLIKTYTNEGEIVLDNCIGSGTTAVAAIRTNRNFIGFETEPSYVEIANKRLDNESEAR
jgi:site-specific DNA-methyltransferase (adenine-specific)